ncbi:MAG: N-acetyl-gamma-glutamyl-phosphate reductase [Acidimicrobiia bacterium]|nr:N-acetyl-gamma-glutamyl-phosphate reductase [Acidimicrobiia bacterium]
MTTTAAVIGASGYGGGELVRFLDAHPEFSTEILGAHSKAGATLGEVHPHLSGGDRELVSFEPDKFSEVDVVFLALPHGASAEPAMQLLERGVKVVDLGSDFRLATPQRYREAYGVEHPYPDQLGEWAYGIPELFADAIAASDRVSAPGCYPTSAVLAIAPIAAAGLIDHDGIVVDALSGVSGAGRGVSEATSFGAIDESVKAYKILEHRHQPEMIQAVDAYAGAPVELVFTPHLVPMQRGILSTMYMMATEGTAIDDIHTAFDKAYADQPFVRLSGVPPETRWVVGSNNALVSYHLDEVSRRLIAVCAIDNLVKGAAGQAVQCANLMFGFDQASGLPTEGWMP